MYTQQQPCLESAERDRLIVDLLPQVHFIAARIHERLPPQTELDDLISAGVIGLIAAVDNFDPTRNVKLRTYAEHKIRGYILNSIGRISGGSRQHSKVRRDVENAIRQAERRKGCVPDSQDIAEELGVSLDEYHALLLELNETTLASLEVGHGEEESFVLGNVPDRNALTPAQIAERQEVEKLLAESIQSLPENERTVLSLYYLEELNLREIGQVMDVHMSRVSQIKTQAIMRLRAELTKLWPGRVEL